MFASFGVAQVVIYIHLEKGALVPLFVLFRFFLLILKPLRPFVQRWHRFNRLVRM